MNNENEYKNYLLSKMEEADANWRKAMSEDRFDDACIYAKQVSDLEAIYIYHYDR